MANPRHQRENPQLQGAMDKARHNANVTAAERAKVEEDSAFYRWLEAVMPVAGTAAGAGIGFAASGGTPMGAMMGGTLGGAAGQAVSSTVGFGVAESQSELRRREAEQAAQAQLMARYFQ